MGGLQRAYSDIGVPIFNEPPVTRLEVHRQLGHRLTVDEQALQPGLPAKQEHPSRDSMSLLSHQWGVVRASIAPRVGVDQGVFMLQQAHPAPLGELSHPWPR